MVIVDASSVSVMDRTVAIRVQGRIVKDEGAVARRLSVVDRFKMSDDELQQTQVELSKALRHFLKLGRDPTVEHLFVQAIPEDGQKVYNHETGVRKCCICLGQCVGCLTKTFCGKCCDKISNSVRDQLHGNVALHVQPGIVPDDEGEGMGGVVMNTTSPLDRARSTEFQNNFSPRRVPPPAPRKLSVLLILPLTTLLRSFNFRKKNPTSHGGPVTSPVNPILSSNESEAVSPSPLPPIGFAAAPQSSDGYSYDAIGSKRVLSSHSNLKKNKEQPPSIGVNQLFPSVKLNKTTSPKGKAPPPPTMSSQGLGEGYGSDYDL